MNITPRTKKAGMTVLAVMTGCHAGNLCCLKAESAMQQCNAPKVDVSDITKYEREERKARV